MNVNRLYCWIYSCVLPWLTIIDIGSLSHSSCNSNHKIITYGFELLVHSCVERADQTYRTLSDKCTGECLANWTVYIVYGEQDKSNTNRPKCPVVRSILSHPCLYVTMVIVTMVIVTMVIACTRFFREKLVKKCTL